MSLWDDTATYPLMAASVAADADQLPYGDMSQAAGSRQRNVTIGTLAEMLRTRTTTAVQWDASRDETTALTVATGALTFRMPFAFSLTSVRASVTTAPVGAAIQLDVQVNGTSVFSTVLSIDDGSRTSVGSAAPAVLTGSPVAVADDDEITVDVTQIGSSTAGAGLKIALLGSQA